MLSVTTAATDLALLSPAELRSATGVESGQDTDLAALGRRVAATITKACRVPAAGATTPTLRLETLTETFRLKAAQSMLVLSRRPLVAITSVVEDSDTLDTDEYEIDGYQLRRLDGDDNPSIWTASKVVVVYRAGWATVPDDLKLAAAKLAGLLWSEGSRIDPNLRRESIPGVIDREWWVGPADDPLIPAEVMQLLSEGGYVQWLAK